MTTKTWDFTLEGQSHTLTLEHGVFSGKRTIILDGQLLEHIPRNLLDTGSAHEYEVDGHSVVVVIQSKVASFVYDLLVDGVSLDTGARGPQRVGNTTMQGTIALVVFVFLIGVGISWFIKSGYDEHSAIQEWPVVIGEIVGNDWDHHSATEDNPEYYHAVLNIAYKVGDARYSVQFDDDQHYGTRDEALKAFGVGDKQALYVNPSDPRESHLYFEKTDPNGWVGTVLVVMGMFTILPLIILVAVWLQTRNTVPV